jgi:hypothetical protein
MDDYFIIPVSYQGKEFELRAKLLMQRYIHRVEVIVDGIPVLFEPDKERNYRALKLIAFEDRPEIRIKDPGDILEIMEHYFELHTDFISENHSDIFERERSLTELSCRVIGREIGNIVEGNSALKNRIQNYLSRQLENPEKSSLFRLMQRSNDKITTDDLVLYAREILGGIGD